MTNPLKTIRTLGQSVWYDDLNRELLRSGDLKRMMEVDGVSGITLNPNSRQRAVVGERAYDNEIHHLVDMGLDVARIYESLATANVQEACDIFHPIYENSSGEDGYVSLAVSPHVAYDTVGMIEQARHLWESIDRKNLLIKIPATEEGIDAVRELTVSGINTEASLIFSLEQYRGVAEAYIEGLERRLGGGDPCTPTSVASFCLNRLDSAVDELLRDILDPHLRPFVRNLLGKTAIAGAKIVYSAYKEFFHGSRFSSMRERGARRQKLVWICTSTKNPDYSDTYYVDALIGPETVITMPRMTLEAYRHHGQPVSRLEEGLETAVDLFARLAQLRIDVDDVMDSLLEEGVQSSTDSFDALLGEIAEKRTRFLRGWGHRAASLGNTLQKAVDEKLSQLDEQKLSDGIWSGDAALWLNDPNRGRSVSRRLGWLRLPEVMKDETDRLKRFGDEIHSAGFTNAVVLGMGGSSLVAEVFSTCFDPMEGFPHLKVLDSTVPSAILDFERSLDLERTLFIVAGKSGNTTETSALFRYFWGKTEHLFGKETGKRFIAITDPGTALGKTAFNRGFRKTFLNPADVGGRYGALSYFGLVPAALMGLDIDRMLMRASQAVEAAGVEVPALENLGLWLGTCMAEASLRQCDKLSLVISPALAAFGSWFEQLIAGSTGKNGKGILPIVGEPLGTPDVYGNDRLFVYLRLDDQGTFDEVVSSLERDGHPVITLRLHSPYDLGRETFRWQLATAVAGAILRINPFDEPDVVESKEITKKLLEGYQQNRTLPTAEHFDVDDPGLIAALKNALDLNRPGAYVAFNAFVAPREENRAILQELRTLVRNRYKVATTVGIGPRYLHSTGQFHKGGSDKGLFIQIVSDDMEDIAVPGAPYSFGVLKNAQALEDYQTLKRKGRRIIRIHLSTESALPKLLEVFESVVDYSERH